MANTFFGFDTSFNNENHLLPDDDADLGEGEEDEYDALNDETFGTLGDSAALNDDWEEQHEQYANYDENSKHSEHIENSIRDLVLNDSDDDERLSTTKPTPIGGWSPNAKNQQSPMPSNTMQQQHMQQIALQQKNGNIAPKIDKLGMELPNIPTVEEIEKMYASSKIQYQQQQQQQLQQQQQQHLQNQQNLQKRTMPPQGARFPPGFYPQPQQRLPPPGIHAQPPPPHRMPPGFPGCLPPGMRPPPAAPGGGSAPAPFPMLRPGMPLPPPPMHQLYANFPLPPPTIRNGPPLAAHLQHQIRQQQQSMMHMQIQAAAVQQQLQQQRQMNQNNNRLVSGGGKLPQLPPPQAPPQLQQQQQQQQVSKDEYDGLMTNREKQWLLNIQHLQLNTGTPYFDDYYYTVFKERKARNDKENNQHAPPLHHHHHHHHHHLAHHHHHHAHQQQQHDRSDGGGQQQQQLQARTYTPLQFENSLGKLQCVSVTAPRKIIDTDVVTLEKDADGGGGGGGGVVGSGSVPPARDTRKTKQLLLDLESLYALVLKAEDLLNPLAVANMEKLVELKQKQRLREMDAAATPEAKRELLRLLQVESAPQTDTSPVDCLLRTMAGLLHEEKFAAFMNIRKGKALLLRVLPLLGADYAPAEYAALWCRVLLCIPVVGRRDMAGDNLLPRLHPYFKRFVQTSRMADVLAIVGRLEQSVRPSPAAAETRGTPLSHLTKAPLQFVVANKFGVSALVTILIRTEYLISSGNATDQQIDEWAAFLQSWADATASRTMMATPLEVIPRPVFVKHANRFPRLSSEKKALLERHYADIH